MSEHLNTLIGKVQVGKVHGCNQPTTRLTRSQIDQIGPKSWGRWQSCKLTIYLRKILWQLMSRMFLPQLILVPPPANRRLGEAWAQARCCIEESDTGHSFSSHFPGTVELAWTRCIWLRFTDILSFTLPYGIFRIKSYSKSSAEALQMGKKID